jgi:hypothetical protein
MSDPGILAKQLSARVRYHPMYSMKGGRLRSAARFGQTGLGCEGIAEIARRRIEGTAALKRGAGIALAEQSKIGVVIAQLSDLDAGARKINYEQ